MKIAFNRQNANTILGPYVFLGRLIEFLKTQKDIEIVKNGRYHDLFFITISGSTHKADQFHAKKILRIDGIYHDLSQNPDDSNRGIRDTYHNVDGIVFQCGFARDMLHRHFGKPQKAKHEVIIGNGVDSSFSSRGEKMDYGFRQTIIVSGRWQIHKRLQCMINTFLALKREDTGMVILGESTEQIQHPRIKYLGTITPCELPKYYRGADIMLHFAYTDWYPNTCIEAISCGVPIITTHNGGVPELIKDCGIVIKSDPDYNMDFIDFNHLPKVDPVIAAEAVNKVLEQKQKYIHNRSDLQIDYCGQQYVDFFKKVINK